MDIKIKTAKGLENLPEAKEIRQKVFVEEQGFVDEFDDIDAIAFHVVVCKNEKAVATGRLFFDGESWHIGRVAVMAEYRGQNIGEKVMSALENYGKEIGVKEISLSAQMQAKGFYEKQGYENCGDLHFDQGCPHITMKKILN